MPSYPKPTSFLLPTAAAKPEVRSDTNLIGKPSPFAPVQVGSMSTGVRTVGRSTASTSVSLTSVFNNSDAPFDDGSLQHQRLEMFGAQHVLDDGNVYARFQTSTNTTAANRDDPKKAREAFYKARAAEAIHQFNNAFNSKK